MKTIGKTSHISSFLKAITKGAGARDTKAAAKTKESFDTQKIKSAWAETVSEIHLKYTKNLALKGTRLIVQISSPVVRSDLFWKETSLLQKLNRELKEEGVKITSIYWK